MAMSYWMIDGLWGFFIILHTTHAPNNRITAEIARAAGP